MAVLAADTIPYFSERKAFDLLGKNDPMVAHQPAQSHVFKPGHNKYDFDRSLTQYKPDLIVPLGWPPWIEDRAEGGWMALDYYGWRDGIFFSSEFQAHYAGSMVVVNDLFPAFVHSDSPERARLMTGECEETTKPYLTTLGIRRFCKLGKWPGFSTAD